jgi:hypothetical protein
MIRNIGRSKSGDRGHIHEPPGRASCIAQRPILCIFRTRALGTRALAAREQRSGKILTSRYVSIFDEWTRSEQRVIIQFLLKENAKGDDIHRRPQTQFTDDTYNIRSSRSRYQFIRQGREDLHDDPRLGRPPIDFIDSKILSALERKPFHSANSLAEIMGTFYSTIIRHL